MQNDQKRFCVVLTSEIPSKPRLAPPGLYHIIKTSQSVSSLPGEHSVTLIHCLLKVTCSLSFLLLWTVFMCSLYSLWFKLCLWRSFSWCFSSCRFWCVAALTWCSSWETSSPHWRWFIRNTWTTRTSPRAYETGEKNQEVNDVQHLSSCRKSPNTM